ncbi:hypothetical protein M768_12615 [Cellulosimicrobium cellulans F16]|uniref:Uncharacterized protein n=1 Tax=Cellulosimicrobium cellulans F16 TaxID=1350482 RepID=A0A0M0F6G7_CELCE|nr:hypothetical protein M768_12615 [Cellulosimicrobium cellulans F16]
MGFVTSALSRARQGPARARWIAVRATAVRRPGRVCAVLVLRTTVRRRRPDG